MINVLFGVGILSNIFGNINHVREMTSCTDGCKFFIDKNSDNNFTENEPTSPSPPPAPPLQPPPSEYGFLPDVFISSVNNGTIKQSFRYVPTSDAIRCSSLVLSNTSGVKIISSRSNNVCIGTPDGRDFEKDYVLGRYENYYLQYTGLVPYSLLKLQEINTNVSFTKDVKTNENTYKSYKYIPITYDTTCNNLFGLKNYTGVNVVIDDTRSCKGIESGFDPDFVLEKFKTYEVEIHNSIEEVYVDLTPSSQNLCTDTCIVDGKDSNSDGTCDDGGQGSSNSACDYGTDCADCGVRINTLSPSPPPPLPPPPLTPPLPPPPLPPPPPTPFTVEFTADFGGYDADRSKEELPRIMIFTSDLNNTIPKWKNKIEDTSPKIPFGISIGEIAGGDSWKWLNRKYDINLYSSGYTLYSDYFTQHNDYIALEEAYDGGIERVYSGNLRLDGYTPPTNPQTINNKIVRNYILVMIPESKPTQQYDWTSNSHIEENDGSLFDSDNVVITGFQNFSHGHPHQGNSVNIPFIEEGSAQLGGEITPPFKNPGDPFYVGPNYKIKLFTIQGYTFDRLIISIGEGGAGNVPVKCYRNRCRNDDNQLPPSPCGNGGTFDDSFWGCLYDCDTTCPNGFPSTLKRYGVD